MFEIVTLNVRQSKTDHQRERLSSDNETFLNNLETFGSFGFGDDMNMNLDINMNMNMNDMNSLSLNSLFKYGQWS